MLSEPRATLLLRAALNEFSQGRPQASEASCLNILRSFPEHAGAFHLLGVVALDRQDFDSAASWLRRAAESPDALPLYLLSYAELILRHRDRRAALALTHRALALDSRAAVGWFSLGDQLLDLRDYAQSKDCFERALELDAGLWQARARLSILLARTGHPSEGIALLTPVLQSDPENADVLASHAALLEEIGQFTDALAEAERAIRKSPRKLDHHLRAVSIEMQLGRHGAALDRLEGAAAAWSGDIRCVVLRATLLRMVDRLEDAVSLCRDALTRGMESAELLRAYAVTLDLEGDLDGAMELLDRAATDRPGAALADKALLLSQRGRLADASAVFAQALEHEPRLVDAWYNRAQLKTHRPDDPDIDAMESLLQGACDFRDRLLLHFALGKAHQDAGHRPAAFEHWTRGNEMKRSIIDYQPETTARDFASIIAEPWKHVDAGEAAGAQSSELPVFIVGMPRCGSSLLEQILASHPAVHGAGEQTGLRRLLRQPRSNDISDDHDRAALALARLRSYSTRAGRIIDKDLQNFQHLGLIHRIFPRARVIHCRRDPVDLCFSAYTKLFVGHWPFAYDLRELGLYYREYRGLMRHWRLRLPVSALMEVDYETLVASPVETTKGVLDFLGLPWDDACMQFVDNGRSVNTASLAQVRQPLYQSSVGRSRDWLAYLEPLTEALGDAWPGRGITSASAASAAPIAG